MKNLFFSLCTALMLQSGLVNAQGHDIKITVPVMAGKQVILGFYRENQTLAADTAQLDASGEGTFKKNTKLAQGLYFLLFSPTSYMDIIIGNNQNFSIKADTNNLLNHLQIEGSPENQAFLEFQRFMATQNQKKRKINEEYSNEANKDREEIKQQYIKRLEQIDKVFFDHITNLGRQYPGSALATFTKAMLFSPVPDFSGEVTENVKDRDIEIQRKRFYYEKAHYWDYINFNDSTLICTPSYLFKNKLDDYFKYYVSMHPDSVYKESVDVIERTKGCKAMFRYLVSHCTMSIGAETDSIMGMDAAYVKFAKRYLLSKDAEWITADSRKKIQEEVACRQYNLIGETAREMKLQTLEGNWVSLHETKAPFTFLAFWEENCGHCKTQIPLVKSVLLDKFKPYGFNVFAVHLVPDKEKWEKFVTEHDLFDFINCWDPHRQFDFRTYYNTRLTPTFYLLDKDKKIIAKSISIEQMAEILKIEYKRAGVEIK